MNSKVFLSSILSFTAVVSTTAIAIDAAAAANPQADEAIKAAIKREIDIVIALAQCEKIENLPKYTEDHIIERITQEKNWTEHYATQAKTLVVAFPLRAKDNVTQAMVTAKLARAYLAEIADPRKRENALKLVTEAEKYASEAEQYAIKADEVLQAEKIREEMAKAEADRQALREKLEEALRTAEQETREAVQALAGIGKTTPGNSNPNPIVD